MGEIPFGKIPKSKEDLAEKTFENLQEYERKAKAASAEYESFLTTLSFKLQGDQKRAEKLGSSILTVAKQMPFSIQENLGASRKLLNFGSQPENLADELTFLSDIAAGSGAPLEKVAQLYSKVRYQGKITSGDLEEFKENGISLADVLTKKFHTTAVGFTEVKIALQSMKDAGGEFFHASDIVNNTTKGREDYNTDQETQELINFGRIKQRYNNSYSELSEGLPWGKKNEIRKQKVEDIISERENETAQNLHRRPLGIITSTMSLNVSSLFQKALLDEYYDFQKIIDKKVEAHPFNSFKHIYD